MMVRGWLKTMGLLSLDNNFREPVLAGDNREAAF
jgi:hypothetical protein